MRPRIVIPDSQPMILIGHDGFGFSLRDERSRCGVMNECHEKSLEQWDKLTYKKGTSPEDFVSKFMIIKETIHSHEKHEMADKRAITSFMAAVKRGNKELYHHVSNIL